MENVASAVPLPRAHCPTAAGAGTGAGKDPLAWGGGVGGQGIFNFPTAGSSSSCSAVDVR